MNVKMGRNVVLVLLVARPNKKVVAAETGVAKLSYSSVNIRSKRLFDISKLLETNRLRS